MNFIKILNFGIFFIALISTYSNSYAEQNYCNQFKGNSDYLKSIDTVAHALQYETIDLCTLSRLNDITVYDTFLYNEKNESIPHYWVTLHYSTYSCQYFVRAIDQIITRKNCYSTE